MKRRALTTKKETMILIRIKSLTAAEHEQGIRILRQDPWEMLITFIISQNRNIPAIRRSVELLAEKCGVRSFQG